MNPRTKSRKLPKSIIELAQSLRLVNFGYREWHVRFDDCDEIDTSNQATVICLPRHTKDVTLICITNRLDLLWHLSKRSEEMRDQGSLIKSYLTNNRFICDRCQAGDVFELSKTIFEVEGRRLAKVIPTVGTAVPMVPPIIAKNGESMCSASIVGVGK